MLSRLCDCTLGMLLGVCASSPSVAGSLLLGFFACVATWRLLPRH